MKIWLGRDELLFIKILPAAEQELCEHVKGLFHTLNDKCKPKHNETISSLEYCKPTRNAEKSTE